MMEPRHIADIRRREYQRDAERVNGSAWMYEELRQRERRGMLWSVGQWLRTRGNGPVDPPGAAA